MQLVAVHHPIEEFPICIGEFVVDIQIPDLLTVGNVGKIAVDPINDRHEAHVVVSWEDPGHYDCRRGRLGLDQSDDRLKASRDIVCPRSGISVNRCITDVICAGKQNDDLGIDSVEFAVFQSPENILCVISDPPEISRVPTKEILFPVGQQFRIIGGTPAARNRVALEIEVGLALLGLRE